MEFKIAVCDDEAAQIQYLAAIVNAWADKNDYSAGIVTFPSAEAFLFAYDGEKDYDILLLDIEMKGISGVELAKRIRAQDKKVQIIFITGFPEYMAEGYEVAAVHYLLKPVSSGKLEQVLERAVGNLGEKEKCLTVRFERQTDYIPYSQIRYIEAQLQYIVVYTKTGEYRMKASLSHIEKELGDGFLRCQRSYIINLGQVQKIKNHCVLLKSGETIPISRGMSGNISRAIIRHFDE